MLLAGVATTRLDDHDLDTGKFELSVLCQAIPTYESWCISLPRLIRVPYMVSRLHSIFPIRSLDRRLLVDIGTMPPSCRSNRLRIVSSFDTTAVPERFVLHCCGGRGRFKFGHNSSRPQPCPTSHGAVKKPNPRMHSLKWVSRVGPQPRFADEAVTTF